LQFTRLTALEDRNLAGVLGFEGRAGLDVLGIALSSGANDVEAAYQLAVYLTSVPELQTVLYDGLPARYSVQQDFSHGLSLSSEACLLSNEALKNALSLSESLC